MRTLPLCVCRPLLLILLALVLPSAARAAEPGYYRFPTIHGDQIVFCSEGDLWSTTSAGGIATRLTSQAAPKGLPRLSPDGKLLAFTGAYQGVGSVYVMTADGGEPKRLTFQAIADEVVGFTPDGANVIFRARNGGLDSEEYLYRVSVKGGQPVKLPLGIAAELSYSPDGKKIAFNRNTWHFNWKHYSGGTAPNIWIADLAAGTFVEASRGTHVAMFPMWIGERIYYVGDAGGALNVLSMKPDGSDVRSLTHHADYDVRQPSTDGQRIIYTCGAALWLTDPVTGTDRKLDVRLPSDRARELDRFEDPNKTLDSVDLNDDGKRVVIASRGQIWATASKPGGRIVKVADEPGVRNRAAAFSPDGEKIVAISDETGEQELALFDAKGREAHKILTHNGQGWLFPPAWSPDSKFIAFGDVTLTLWLADADTGKLTKVEQSKNAEITDYSFSPDGKWLAYAVTGDNQLSQIRIYDVGAAKSYPLGSGFTNDWSPSWDPDGKYLYFLSNRSFDAIADDFEINFSVQSSAKPCLAILTKDGKSPFLPDEVLEPDKKDEDAESADEGTTQPATKPATQPVTKPATTQAVTKPATTPAATQVAASHPATTSGPATTEAASQPAKKKPARELTETKVDPEGIADRVIELPTNNDNYDGLTAASGRVFYLLKPPNVIGGEDATDGPKQAQLSLRYFDIKDKKADEYAGNVDRYAISGDGKRIAFHRDGQIVVSDVSTKPGDDPEEKVELGRLPLKVDVQKEWAQIFAEAWRLQRDFYWDPHMSGVDWPAVRAKYEPLLPRVGTRGELNDVIGQMQGELGNSHEYVFGGDPGEFHWPTPPPVGLLGADVELDIKTGLFKFVRVYKPEGWETDIDAPLAASYVNVHDGDYLLAINGHTLAKDDSVDELMADQAMALVQITVATKADKSDSRDLLLTPLATDEELRYRDWCRRNREYVDRKSNGRLGYMHLPDMEGPGLDAFIRGFYPQQEKDGLIIDERDNHGGWVSQMLISRLARHVWAYQRPRRGRDFKYPSAVAEGYKVVLIDQFAGSDGDIFPDSFRTLGLGPLIGKRTWGGVIGIRMDKPFIDGGMSSQPEYAFWDPKRGWPMENHGVDPDIEVDRTPADYLKDRDPQLDRGIEELLRMLKEKPLKHPMPPPPPDRARQLPGQ